MDQPQVQLDQPQHRSLRWLYIETQRTRARPPPPRSAASPCSDTVPPCMSSPARASWRSSPWSCYVASRQLVPLRMSTNSGRCCCGRVSRHAWLGLEAADQTMARPRTTTSLAGTRKSKGRLSSRSARDATRRPLVGGKTAPIRPSDQLRRCRRSRRCPWPVGPGARGGA